MPTPNTSIDETRRILSLIKSADTKYYAKPSNAKVVWESASFDKEEANVSISIPVEIMKFLLNSLRSHYREQLVRELEKTHREIAELEEKE